MTVTAADSALGRTIAVEVATRGLKVRAAVGSPGRWSSDRIGPYVVRGDILDLSAPETLLDGCDVLVVPLGTSDPVEVPGSPAVRDPADPAGPSRVDFAGDLYRFAVIASLAPVLEANRTAILLVGRALQLGRPPAGRPRATGVAGPWVHLEAARIAERAVLSMVASQANLDWVYTSPVVGHRFPMGDRSPTLDGSVRRDEFERNEPALGRYTRTVVDLVESLAAPGNGGRDGDRVAQLGRVAGAVRLPIGLPGWRARHGRGRIPAMEELPT